ncbi:MAG TPA: hypothetical protein VGC13_17395 [Longimicrobium sp.]|jgi:hypothetical protein|uniref:hypothetical protein n=1 Tax=Longimicrobium sp. TaxID=2029185 RepID=UPI002ED8DE3E
MRKLSLNPDDLRVDSFETGDGQDARKGTVRGYWTAACPVTVRKTEDATCPQTCDDGTCVGSCQGTSCYLPACNTCNTCADGCIPQTGTCTD